MREKVTVGGKEVIKPWTPHWVFHGSGVLHNERTGCIACPCDCPGGIIADNRNPIFETQADGLFRPRGGPTQGLKSDRQDPPSVRKQRYLTRREKGT